MTERQLLEKIYAGFIGMNAGIRLGAPVEPTVWTSERIERFYGDITSYVKDFKNFAADDDANGPVFFLRALDDLKGDSLTSGDVASAWLNYAREGIGMFWWGGYGVSTEHTAYLNLKNGMKAPESGSIKTNGKIMAEQIGGQIFIDTWGLVCPGNAEKAASFARTAASVSHDGDGLEGAAFVAAAIALAFEEDNVDSIVQKALSYVSEKCTYRAVVEAVIEFYKENPSSWRDCLKMLQENWGYDKYKGVCHIIPNAGVVVMSLLYGRTFQRAIEIATMAGWDTDCNAGNVGTIMGVLEGLDGLGEKYRAPINDLIVLSGVSGYLNVLDIPTYSKKLASLALILQNKKPSKELSYDERYLNLDFDLPGSTHGIKISNTNQCKIYNAPKCGKDNTSALAVLFDRMVRGQSCKIYYKSFWRREDFDDERYMPVFSPTVYAGQKVTITVRFDRFTGESMILSPYVRNTYTKEIVYLSSSVYKDDNWHTIEFTVPDLDGSPCDEIGLILEANSPAKNRDFGLLYIDSIKVTGSAEYTIDVSKSRKELASITPFSHNHGSWELYDGKMEAMSLSECEAFTGNYFAKDIIVQGSVKPFTGCMHLVSLRVQGAQRGYYAGLDGDGLSILKKVDGKIERLSHVNYNWEYDKEYDIVFSAIKDELTLSIDGAKILNSHDSEYKYGMVGYAEFSGGRRAFGNMKIKEIN